MRAPTEAESASGIEIKMPALLVYAELQIFSNLLFAELIKLAITFFLGLLGHRQVVPLATMRNSTGVLKR
jgi:hypothetical protein